MSRSIANYSTKYAHIVFRCGSEADKADLGMSDLKGGIVSIADLYPGRNKRSLSAELPNGVHTPCLKDLCISPSRMR